ncbi:MULTISPECIES: hypothetical protein [unclassified Cryobacterium]|uniref:hypothetical protein n=1 Tax=unclassified Cryobacterium TaxID=2649013 RepID=UPI00106DB7B9|nr:MULTISPECIES: hypothetical protein [unclassified Cryobacterium]MDY7527348.1 hypothetical protein [Cryobacterium sp. 10C2]MDY7556864.1 hypothetical protein [Cryobacterium sp. 10C3]MEB0002274.1 hypothetical protein [Cryobacterium sp. RTC2.1]MEB0202390.1 hypothetical protein [Cryobacterium sp. 5I3]MEB0287378.1 hypothetical protein [Cryobacterium sp. 10S3]
MNHESSDLPQKSEHAENYEHTEHTERTERTENVAYTESLKHADEPEHGQTLAPSEVGSMFSEYRRRQLNIFRERESTLELDDTAI